MNETITLLAMAPSGETFIVRHPNGQVWLIQPAGAGEPELVDEEVVARAVADHGFHRLDEEFESWADLDDFRQRRAAEVTPEVIVDRDALDLDDVRQFLDAGRRWVADGEGPLALSLALELLRVPVVRADPQALDSVVSFLETLNAAPPDIHSQPTTPLQSAARDRWRQSVLSAA